MSDEGEKGRFEFLCFFSLQLITILDSSCCTIE